MITKKQQKISKGCGNGQAAIAFHEEGYTDVTGVDYCESAIELSTKIAKQQNAEAVTFKVCFKLMCAIVPVRIKTRLRWNINL